MSRSTTSTVRRLWILCGVMLLGLLMTAWTADAQAAGRWVTGDHHSHTRMSDGDAAFPELVEHAFGIGALDWVATADHGGWSMKDAEGVKLDEPVWMWRMFLDDPNGVYDFGWPVLLETRADYPGKVIVQGLEWGVHSADEAKVGIVADEPSAISDFEYMFDKLDLDTSRADESLVKQNDTWEGSLAAVSWLQENYAGSSYAIISHPSRALKWTVGQFRAFNDAAPDVAFGFCGIPGSQKELPCRGGYDEDEIYVSKKGKKAARVIDWERILEYARTYGGADYMVAKVGGLWDALLGEGREWWMFSDSDFHNEEEEFWPGEYSKDHTWVDEYTAEGVVEGLRSGKTFSVEGQLIDDLEFSAGDANESVGMGDTLAVKSGKAYTITIRFRSPAVNNNGDAPVVDHVDLIAGKVGERYDARDKEYETRDTNTTTAVLARFDEGDWTADGGWNVITYDVKKAATDMYYRLRGTNMGVDVDGQTDAQGNPLADYLEDGGTAEDPMLNDEFRPWADLWFYSNPIFVDVD